MISDNSSFFDDMNIQILEPQAPAMASMIWLHGLGADANDMIGLVQALNLSHLPIRFLFLNAPMRSVTINNNMVMPAWYDIKSLSLTDREDEQGVLETEGSMLEVIEQQFQQGIQHIYLAGFSQGGAMSLFTGLRMKNKLAGIIALSAYLPLRATFETFNQPSGTPIFMGSGINDPLVKHQWSQQTAEMLEAAGFNLSWHAYPMEHAVCPQEMQDLSAWITNDVNELKG
jgi:phospholipase/carboxylesterase